MELSHYSIIMLICIILQFLDFIFIIGKLLNQLINFF